MANELILVVDDEAGMRKYLKKLLTDNNFRVRLASNGEDGLEKLQKDVPDLVLADLKMPKMDGLRFLKEIRKEFPKIIVIIMTAYGTMDSAIKAMKLGAYDYINKPFEIDEILLVIDKALEKKRIEEENIILHKELKRSYTFEDIVSQDYKMRQIFDLVKRIADTKSTVLIRGETGTGKELIARAIHNISSRADRPFIPVSDKKGLFEAADGGTVFLDEVGHVSTSIQAKLLRVLQDGVIKRVGDVNSRKVDTRLISATNEDLEKSVQEGTFREDLYYRINVVPIWIPPLRDRKGDIPLLVEHFINKYNYLEKKNLQGVSRDALNILMSYDWPGNVRELENFIQRAVVLGVGPIILPRDLPASVRISETAERRDTVSRTGNFRKARKMAIEVFEKRFLIEALKKNNGNVSKTAKEIGLDRRNLQKKIKYYKISL